MKKVKGIPITASRTAMKFSPPVKTTSKTSADIEKIVAQPPFPFKNKQSVLASTGGNKASGGISTMEPKIASGLQHSNPGAKALPSGGPVGQRVMPNQSKQIGGRTSVAPMKRAAGYNDNPKSGSMGRQPIRGADSAGHSSGPGQLAKVTLPKGTGVASGGPGSANPMANQSGSAAGRVPNNALQAGGRNPSVGERGRGGEFAKPNRKGKGAAFYGGN